MFDVSLYDVDVMIDIRRENSDLVARATQPKTAWMEISVDNMTQHFDLMGVSQMDLDFMDDDYIVFKKSKGSDRVIVTISKHGIARTVGKMLEYLADTTLSLFGRDED